MAEPLTLTDPTRSELRMTFENLDTIGEVIVVHPYPLQRLYQWALRHGWKVRINKLPEGYRITHLGGDGPQPKARNHPLLGLRQRLDELVLNGAIPEPEGYDPGVLVTLPGKVFKRRPLDNGTVEIVRVV